MDADLKIATEVDTLNTKLGQIRDLNFDIARRGNGGHSTAALEDHRSALLDDVSRLVPLREVKGDNGQISLFTLGGTQLLSGQVSDISFFSTVLIIPHMTLDNGLLGGLEVKGSSVDAADVFAGGSIAAHFEVRDELAVTAQRQLDAVARDLVEARHLQQSLVPEEFLSFSGANVSLMLRHSGHEGGDLVGAFRVSDTRIGI